MQIVCSFAKTLDVPWPTSFHAILGARTHRRGARTSCLQPAALLFSPCFTDACGSSAPAGKLAILRFDFVTLPTTACINPDLPFSLLLNVYTIGLTCAMRRCLLMIRSPQPPARPPGCQLRFASTVGASARADVRALARGAPNRSVVFVVASSHALLRRLSTIDVASPLRRLAAALGLPARHPDSSPQAAERDAVARDERLERLRVTVIGRVLLVLYVCYAGVCQKVCPLDLSASGLTAAGGPAPAMTRSVVEV